MGDRPTSPNKGNARKANSFSLKSAAVGKSGGVLLSLSILGGNETGKTTLVNRIMGLEDSEDYEPTTEAVHVLSDLDLEGVSCLTIVDTGGHWKLSQSSRPQWIEMADAVIVTYNVTNAESLIHAQQCLKEIEMDNEVRKRPIQVIGNVWNENPEDREVLLKTGQDFADRGNAKFVEMDLKTTPRDEILKLLREFMATCPAMLVGRAEYASEVRDGSGKKTPTPSLENTKRWDSNVDLEKLRAHAAAKSGTNKEKRKLKTGLRGWMKRRKSKPYPLSAAMQPDSVDNSFEFDSMDLGETALGVILSDLYFKSAFCQFLRQQPKPTLRHRVLFYDDAKNTYKERKKNELLGHAHLLFQKYIDRNSLYNIDVEDEIIAEIESALWDDADGMDSSGLVTANLFDAALEAVEPDLEELGEDFLHKIASEKNKNGQT